MKKTRAVLPSPSSTGDFINESEIFEILNCSKRYEDQQVRDIFHKALQLQGLNLEEVAILCSISDPELIHELFQTAKKVKEEIYGKRLVIFAPLYVSNLCSNECLYCAFRARNTTLKRRSLSYEEIAQEVQVLLNQGHKRVLLVAGEAYPQEGFDYILKAIEIIYAQKTPKGEIRRINVNIAPLEVDEFRRLKEAKIGTYQLFQETYHRETYHKVHIAGKKADYDYRITAPDRAMVGGIDDIGIGVLFGLYDWRFELLALLQHARYLDQRYGVGPHTISVPRLEPATGSSIASHPPHPVDDFSFRKIVAILRLAVPYTGIILSTRETPNLRRETFALGVSQISAGSRTNPGGYSNKGEEMASQFSLGDHRPLDEVIRDICTLGYVPSFCTACYRLGRTGQDFMDLAKPGLIKKFCDVNALSTFAEYLKDFASPETKEVGVRLIDHIIHTMPPSLQKRAKSLVNRVEKGEHDVYV